MDVRSVHACVQAGMWNVAQRNLFDSLTVLLVIHAFHDAAGLIRQIKENRDNGNEEECWEQQMHDLKLSLQLGPPIVQGQYDSDFRRFGETYARGDGIAREQLKDVLITFQIVVLSNLTGVSLGNRSLDHRALQNASDDSRVNAILCLIQWQHRLSSAVAAQQQKPNFNAFELDSIPQTPPLTHVSSHSGQSSLAPGCILGPDDANDHMACLSITPGSPELLQTFPVSTGQSNSQNSYGLPRAGGRGDIDMPSPLFTLSKTPLREQMSATSSDVPCAIPVRSPHRPLILTPQQALQLRPVTEDSRPDLSSPETATGSQNEHFGSDFDSRSSLPRQLESPVINYAALYSPAAQGNPRAPSSGSSAFHDQSSYSDHSTLEPVSMLETSNILPPYRKDSPRAPTYAASHQTLATRSIPLNPISAKKPQRIQSLRDSFMPTSVTTTLKRRSRTVTNRSSSRPGDLPGLSLPDESNSYHGFCKGAYKLQVGGLPAMTAFVIETRPQGLYSSFQVWRCSKCSFEGPLSLTASLPRSGFGGIRKAGRPEKRFDPKLRRSEGGITYRWAFLAKCHVTTRGAVAAGVRDGSFGTFGCPFCAVEGLGRGWLVVEDPVAEEGARAEEKVWKTTAKASTTLTMPMFGSTDSFMQHLEMHRTPEGMPGPEMQRRMKCVVGRIAEVDEDFDINLPPPPRSPLG